MFCWGVRAWGSSLLTLESAFYPPRVPPYSPPSQTVTLERNRRKPIPLFVPPLYFPVLPNMRGCPLNRFGLDVNADFTICSASLTQTALPAHLQTLVSPSTPQTILLVTAVFRSQVSARPECTPHRIRADRREIVLPRSFSLPGPHSSEHPATRKSPLFPAVQVCNRRRFSSTVKNSSRLFDCPYPEP